MHTLWKNFLVVFLLLISLSALFALVSSSFKPVETIPFSTLVQDIVGAKVSAIVVSGNSLLVTYADEKSAKSRKESEVSLSESLLNYGVSKDQLAALSIDTRDEAGPSSWLGPISFIIIPLLSFAFLFWVMMRQARAGMSQAFDFTKTKARLFGAEGQSKERVSFKEVAGLKEAKEEVQEIVDFLKNPKKYQQMGARIPKGVLLIGAPGTGKTLLAKAVAAEANVPFFSASGSEFIEMFVGVGSSRVRDLFATAKKAGRSIIFIDELDAIGRVRGVGFGGGHDEREQTLNQILVEMDGFERNDTQIVMAATNRPDVLDPALLRPGRFDRTIILDLPDVHDREEILHIHAKEKPLSPDVKFREVAERTPGFSGADLANLMNEAAILAARRNQTQVRQNDLFEAIEKVLLGPERKSHVLSKKEKEITAFHEAGHALVAATVSHADPVRKISIISRGKAGGYTLKLPVEDKHLKTKTEFLAELAVLLGGYVAERLTFKEMTTGASNDLSKASQIARSLVKEFGMSEKLGPLTFGEREESMFLKQGSVERRNYSDKIAAEIDEEVRTLIKNAQKTAERVLSQRKSTLVKIAKVLVEKETIEREEFEKLVKSARSSIG
ncbi:MAG: ATP-dependent zinc metalloprotease FtsH [Candidatus Wildermuthbacteria bacterium]|nr:ATP-dependent zinc metalloprotease FtsH [Candidatus Wildermuthbacteria bacterium]